MNKIAIFALLATLATTGQALNCYECRAWEGVQGHNEACRANGVNSVNCDLLNTLLFDPVTHTLINRTVADLDPNRAIGDTLCLKVTGTDPAGKNLIFRGCGEALVGGDLNGQCEKLPSDANVGYGIIKAGAVSWISTTTNGNGGSVSATCGAGQMVASLGLLVSMVVVGIRMIKA